MKWQCFTRNILEDSSSPDSLWVTSPRKRMKLILVNCHEPTSWMFDLEAQVIVATILHSWYHCTCFINEENDTRKEEVIFPMTDSTFLLCLLSLSSSYLISPLLTVSYIPSSFLAHLLQEPPTSCSFGNLSIHIQDFLVFPSLHFIWVFLLWF